MFGKHPEASPETNLKESLMKGLTNPKQSPRRTPGGTWGEMPGKLFKNILQISATLVPGGISEETLRRISAFSNKNFKVSLKSSSNLCE